MQTNTRFHDADQKQGNPMNNNPTPATATRRNR